MSVSRIAFLRYSAFQRQRMAVIENGAVRLYTTLYCSVTVTIALSGTVFFCYLTLNNIVTLKSRLEIRSLKVIQNGTIRKLVCGPYSPSIVTMALCCIDFRDKARYWSKIVIISYPLHSTPPLKGGGYPSEFGTEKN